MASSAPGASSSSRRVCATCDLELALTAYYRHKTDKNGTFCPGKRRKVCLSDNEECSAAEDNNLEEAIQLDSSFDLSEEGDRYEIGNVGNEPLSESSDSDVSLSDSQEVQIWDDDDSVTEDVYNFLNKSDDPTSSHEMNKDVSRAVSGIAFFIVFFHLICRVSERSIKCLLMFFHSLFQFLSNSMRNKFFSQISESLPKTLHYARKMTLKESCKSVEYVVCPKCNYIYVYSECIQKTGGIEKSMKCQHIEFPRHPHLNQRKPCDEVLLKEIKVGKKLKLVPRKVFIYRSVVESLKEMASRDQFLEKCELWRHQANDHSQQELGDIYDGKMWSELQQINGRPFLSLPNNLCLALNIDWFNPYEQTPYSVGAIYLSVLNLPRNERYKEKNIVLVGLIPGPTEPKQHINHYLSPLVEDLKKLYQGVIFKTSGLFGFTMLRAMLACISCDLPATRKVCGFSSYNAKFGCSKCMKEFPISSFGSKPMYGGYNYSNWTVRNSRTHIEEAKKYRNASTNAERTSISQRSGVKYSILLEAPALDIVRCHIIDPMHCIFLGIAKHTIQVWKEKLVIEPKEFKLIQEKIDSIVPPKNIGRIPRKIECGFSSLTADEWKNWIVLYSTFALKDVIGNTHLECWSLFVKSCCILCQPLISKNDVTLGQSIMIEFCKTFERLYGSECCTPNMHMACHLQECILDFGPLLSFWCFPYERYNGVLEGFNKSWIQPEKQLFLKFFGVQQVQTLCDSTFLKETDFFFLMKDGLATDFSSFGQSQRGSTVAKFLLQNTSCNVSLIDAEKKDFHNLIPPYKEKFFNEVHHGYIQEVYDYLYPNEKVVASRCYLEYQKCFINCEEYISVNCRSGRSSAVVARWSGIRGGIDKFGEGSPRIGQIKSIVVNEAKIPVDDGQFCSKTHIFAHINWYEEHLQRQYYPQPIILCSTSFSEESCAIFIPVSRILSRCAISSRQTIMFDYGTDYAIAAVPLKNIYTR